MSDNSRIVTNLERFNDHVKRTSQRLSDRAGSAPLEDRPSTTNPIVDNTSSSKSSSTRGRGRGRGKKSTSVNTRANAAARTLAAGAAATAAAASTGLAELGNDATDNSQTNQTKPTEKESAPNNTEVLNDQAGDALQPGSLIERDEVNGILPCKQRTPFTHLGVAALSDATYRYV